MDKIELLCRMYRFVNGHEFHWTIAQSEDPKHPDQWVWHCTADNKELVADDVESAIDAAIFHLAPQALKKAQAVETENLEGQGLLKQMGATAPLKPV